MAERLRRLEEFSGSEVGFTFVGVLIDSITHMMAESGLDRVLEDKYPEKYPLYSTGIASGIHTAIGVALALYGGKIRYHLLQYIGWGMVFSEISSWMDMFRISFELKR